MCVSGSLLVQLPVEEKLLMLSYAALTCLLHFLNCIQYTAVHALSALLTLEHIDPINYPL